MEHSEFLQRYAFFLRRYLDPAARKFVGKGTQSKVLVCEPATSGLTDALHRAFCASCGGGVATENRWRFDRMTEVNHSGEVGIDDPDTRAVILERRRQAGFKSLDDSEFAALAEHFTSCPICQGLANAASSEPPPPPSC